LPLSAWTPLIGTASSFDIYAYLEQQIGRPIDRADVQERRRARYHELVTNQVVLPGVEECIRDAKARGMKVGLASASWGGWAPGHLERLGLHVHFDTIKTAADVERVKPDPELYLAALGALGLAANEAIALEDSPNGIAAAKAAGLFCVAIPNIMTRDLDVSAADLRLDSLTDMPLADLLAIAESRSTGQRSTQR
jgi:HAD superfamily hydrolase (TIGR01509 family)